MARWNKLFLFVVISFLAFSQRALAADRVDFPNPVGYVNDFANVLTNDEELNQKLESLDQSDGTQILVITTNELPREVVLETFIPRLTDGNPEWAAGQAENDNGVIFTIVINDRTMRIDVGYGLEGALPDLLTQHIQDDFVRPYFQSGDYDGGVNAGVDKIIEAVKGEYTINDVESEQEFSEQLGNLFGQLCTGTIMILFFIFPWLGAYLGRTKSWWLGGVVGAVLGLISGIWLSTFSILGAFRYMGFGMFPLILGGLGLLFDYLLSKNYKKRLKKGLPTDFRSSWGGFSSGSSSWGHSSSSHSSGGFSSGGGSFGGGGSSSGW